MNDDDSIDLEASQPSFLEDGLGISAGQGEFPPFEQDDQEWDTDAWSRDINPDQDEIAATPESCMGDAGDPPDTGTYVLGSVDGTCQWIDTTTCS